MIDIIVAQLPIQSIKWSKTSRSGKTKYMTMDGKELVLNDGNTWIHIQPTNQTLKIE